jgi:hypothetical protein
MLEETNLHKLITKEDPTHIHKLLGIFALANYIYRYYLLFFYGSMFLNTPLDLGMVAIHGCLSLSSLIFHIPRKRHAKLPMIYPEFRLHSIVFGMRSVICCFVDVYGGYYKLYFKMGVCFATMMVADLITKQYAEPGDTTMRAMPYAETTPEKDIRIITKFHSIQQMSATVYMLLNVDAAFSPLFAIQFAAFLMTMVRKSIIRPNTWHLLYSWALMINVFILITLPLSSVANIFIGTQVFLILRMKYRMNKYIAWSFIFLIISLLDLSIIDTYTYNKYIINGLIVSYLCKKTYATRALYYN